MKWGQITWIFLHTLSMKIQPEQYPSLRESLFGLLQMICNALPCPECSAHAMQYMKKKSSPETIEKFRLFLWEFHNVVNVNTKKPMVPPDVLLKYNNTDLKIAFHLLQQAWLSQPYNPHLINKQMMIKHALQQTKKWLLIHSFLST